MGLGVNIFLTGLLFFGLSGAFIYFSDLGNSVVSLWIKVIMVLTWYASLAAMIIGTLIAIWVE